jgi:phenylpyruvate tautomerase PptA (4-oxalocrotonate tautomerase family)
MRKIILWLGRVPSSIAKFAKDAKGITDLLIRLADSDTAKLIVAATPTDIDNILREKIVKVLKRLVPIFKSAQDEGAKKAIAARIGGEITGVFDGNKESTGVYMQSFEKIVNNA